MYEHLLPFNDDPSEADIRYWAAKRLEAGFTALKTSMLTPPVRHIDTLATVRQIVRRMEQLRDAVGEDIDFSRQDLSCDGAGFMQGTGAGLSHVH